MFLYMLVGQFVRGVRFVGSVSMRNSVGVNVCSNITFKLYHPTYYKHIARMLHIQSHMVVVGNSG